MGEQTVQRQLQMVPEVFGHKQTSSDSQIIEVDTDKASAEESEGDQSTAETVHFGH